MDDAPRLENIGDVAKCGANLIWRQHLGELAGHGDVERSRQPIADDIGGHDLHSIGRIGFLNEPLGERRNQRKVDHGRPQLGMGLRERNGETARPTSNVEQ